MHLGGARGYNVLSAPDVNVMHQLLVGSVGCCRRGSCTVEHRVASCKVPQTHHQKPHITLCTKDACTLHAELHIMKQEGTCNIMQVQVPGCNPMGCTDRQASLYDGALEAVIISL